MRPAPAKIRPDVLGLAYTWWTLAALTGPIAALLPHLLMPGESQQTKLLLSCAAFFLAGSLLGCVAPERPWRWAIALILLVPFVDAVRAAPISESLTPTTLLEELLATREHGPVYLLQALAGLAGACVGTIAGRRV